MNKSITKTILAIAFLLIGTFSSLFAQVVVPTTTGVSLFCQGTDLVLEEPPVANTNWIMKYSADKSIPPTEGVALTNGTTIPGASLKTGYYYLSSKSTVDGSCESELQEIPVYVLKPLVVDITPADFCLESPLEQKGIVTNPEVANIPVLAYQWYTVDAANAEIAISAENQVNYTPKLPITAGPKKYRLKVGYVINGNKYCPQDATETITVTPKPVKPTITPGTIRGTATAVTF